MTPSALDCLLSGLAAVGAGLVNAVAGGGTLISFPALVALGVPAVQANVTNTVALCPGYLGGTLAQRDDLSGQRGRLRALAVLAGIGGLIGSILLVLSPEDLFRALVPFLLVGASLLLAVQPRVRRWLGRRQATRPQRRGLPGWAPVVVFVAAIYGGYFGAGLGIVLLAVLGLALDDPLPRVNALKQALSLVINVVAALFFVFSGKVVWLLALSMAVGSLAGGHLGGRLAGRLDPDVLRAVVVVLGLVVAVRFWL